eukprot:TRINITY_DN2137_c0_g1_i10.p1 TRINITY_DN2137_c0_g1~~TRINITY_DN2137_c0_g1_i10.p1  ORF type:complete len:273 (+),score=5.38 TRINITY_DN2137_c0_g1_i10:1-819(+)
MHLQLQMKGQKHLHQHLLIKQMFTIERLQVLLKKVRQQFLIKKKQIEQKRWLIDHINKRPGSNFVRSVLKAKPCKIKGCWKDYCVLVGISVKIRGMQIGSISNVQRPYKHRTLPTFYCCCTGAKSRAKQRIMQDLKRIQRSPPPGISAGPVSEHNIMKWDAIILGPKNTIYEGGAYKLSITFTDMYPNQPPTFKFKQKIFHPNRFEQRGDLYGYFRNAPGIQLEGFLVETPQGLLSGAGLKSMVLNGDLFLILLQFQQQFKLCQVIQTLILP